MRTRFELNEILLSMGIIRVLLLCQLWDFLATKRYQNSLVLRNGRGALHEPETTFHRNRYGVRQRSDHVAGASTILEPGGQTVVAASTIRWREEVASRLAPRVNREPDTLRSIGKQQLEGKRIFQRALGHSVSSPC